MMRLRPHINVSLLLGITPPDQPLCIGSWNYYSVIFFKVTEYYPNGSLWKYLQNKEAEIPRNKMIKIIKGSASGRLVFRIVSTHQGSVIFIMKPWFTGIH
jgi:hypothetical protein